MEPFTSATDTARAIRNKEVSPVEVLEECLRRVDELNPGLNAVVWRNDDEARKQARAIGDALAAGAGDLGPFAGIPIPIKDLSAVTGWPVSFGSKASPSQPSDGDAAIVADFRRAGFVLCGRTNSPEFGTITATENVKYGITRNPWNTDHTTGGSSGGAGAAVASGMFPVAHANDGGGSIRIPASCCGLVGLKPSRGRTHFATMGWLTMEAEGVETRTVSDTAAVLDVISGLDPGAWENAPAPVRPFAQEVGVDPGALRIGLLTTSGLGVEVASEPKTAAEQAARSLESLGHHVEVLKDDVFGLEGMLPFMHIVYSGYADYEGIDWSRVEPHNAYGYSVGQQTDSLALVRSVHELRRITRSIAAHWGREFDVLVTPTMCIEPPKAGVIVEAAHATPEAPPEPVLAMAAFTAAYNITGQPAISLPVHWSPSGLPVGVQLVGAPWREDTLIRVASQLEQAMPWKDRRPPTPSSVGSR